MLLLQRHYMLAITCYHDDYEPHMNSRWTLSYVQAHQYQKSYAFGFGDGL